MKKIRVLLTIIMLIVWMLPTGVMAKQENIVYTALGDSIAFGVGASYVNTPDSNGYVELFSDHLDKMYNGVMTYNYSAPGATSDDLEEILSVPTVTGAIVQASVSEASIITVSIGGNDLLGFVSDNYPITVTGEALLASLSSVQSSLSQAALEFCYYNWPSIIGSIKTLNDDANIYVNTIYNPFLSDEVFASMLDVYDLDAYYYPGSPYESLIDGFFIIIDGAISYMNEVIKTGAGIYGYNVVDVYAAFEDYSNPNKPLIHDFYPPYYPTPDIWKVPIHPTDRGYKMIYNLHKDLLPE